ncbi:MAG: hypothetical protein AAB475_00780 [Patescibacteria group bacterium]
MEENFNQNQNNFSENTSENQNTEMSVPTTPEQSHQESGEKKSVGPIIGIAIIVVIIIFGGLYYWGSKLNTDDTIIDIADAPTVEEIINQEDISLGQLQVQSSSDEIVNIEADLNLTDLENLDAELGNIDAELGL